MARVKTFDPKCLELAEHFLQDLPNYMAKHGEALALDIQQAIEDWLTDNYEPPDAAGWEGGFADNH